jgi:DNA-binding transcriptional ArsR family regulator
MHIYEIPHINTGRIMGKILREEVNQLHANICNGLADPIRILLLYQLSENPSSVNNLAASINLSQPTVSRHLKILKERGLVFQKREGQFVFYYLSDRRVIEALELLRSVMADNLTERARIASLDK